MTHSRPAADDPARNPLRLRRDQWTALTRTFAPLMILLAVTAQLADAATFAIGTRLIGIGYEANGFASGIYHAAGLDGVLVSKGIAILATVGVLAFLARRLPRAFTVGAATATAIGLLGALANASTVAALVR